MGMCEIAALGDPQGLWEERETASCLPRFPSGRYFHRESAVRFLGRSPSQIPDGSFSCIRPLSLSVMMIGKCFGSSCAFMVVSASRDRLFSTMAVWFTR